MDTLEKHIARYDVTCCICLNEARAGEKKVLSFFESYSERVMFICLDCAKKIGVMAEKE
jgi:hypothetical protein